MKKAIEYDCNKHFGCPMFLTQVEADNHRQDAYDSPERFEVQLVDLHGPLWVIVPKPKTRKCSLITMRVLVVDSGKIDRIVDSLHGEGHDCRVDKTEDVDVDEDYKWDCSFFEEEKC